MGYRKDQPPGQVQHPKWYWSLNWEHAKLLMQKTTRGAPESPFPSLCRFAVFLCKQGTNSIAPIFRPSFRFFMLRSCRFQPFRSIAMVSKWLPAQVFHLLESSHGEFLVHEKTEESSWRGSQLIWFQCRINSKRFFRVLARDKRVERLIAWLWKLVCVYESVDVSVSNISTRNHGDFIVMWWNHENVSRFSAWIIRKVEVKAPHRNHRKFKNKLVRGFPTEQSRNKTKKSKSVQWTVNFSCFF